MTPHEVSLLGHEQGFGASALDMLRPVAVVANLIRGALIGVAEVIPGVSGGTLALIVGIYGRLVDAGATLVLAVRRLLHLTRDEPGLRQASRTAASAPWGLLIPVGIGMVAAVILGARFIEPLLDSYPEQMRAVFFGLVAAGIVVPAGIVARLGRWRPSEYLLALIAAAAAFALTGLPPTEIANPTLPLVFIAAAVAVCALVLPGVSGSFLLLSVGLYEPTIDAVNDRNLSYLIVFGAGAVVGLAVFVSVLRWLLTHRLRVTLVILSGLMLGSLRALWPWQDDDRGLLAPSGNIVLVLLLAVASGAVVLGLLALERRFGTSEADADLGTLPRGRTNANSG
jgi:putative membrane protein